VVNTFLAIVFFQRKYRSPVTIFLAVLAITDCLTAVFASIPNVVGYYFKYAELERTSDSYWKGWSCKHFQKFSACTFVFLNDNIHRFHHDIFQLLRALYLEYNKSSKKTIRTFYAIWLTYIYDYFKSKVVLFLKD
jgi:hypothetical protein